MATVKELKQISVLDVARSLGMEMKRQSGDTYYWTEHDSFKINTRRNIWHWFSQDKGGEAIRLVQEIKQVSFKEAKHFVETGEFPEANTIDEEPRVFVYFLEKYEHPNVDLGREYLRDERGLSEETIDTFIAQGSIAEATRKKGDYFEPVIVFKSKDSEGKTVGASLQGIVENRVQHPERGRLKQIMSNSDGLAGFSFDVGIPKRLVFFESPIDLMSYYELKKDTLQDVRLVSMDGLKKGVISRYTADLLTDGKFSQEKSYTSILGALDTLNTTTDLITDDLITIAVDNDKEALKFVEKLKNDQIPIQVDLPPRAANQDKMDWNDYLKQEKGMKNVAEIKKAPETQEQTILEQQKKDMQLKDILTLHREWEQEIKNKVAQHLGHTPQWWELERNRGAFITSELDQLFAKRSSLELDAHFADNSQYVRQEIKQLDEQILTTIQQEKAPERTQEQAISEQQKNDRSKISVGSSQIKAEGSAEPVPKPDTFEQTVTSHPTVSYPLLHFSTENMPVSSVREHYKVATEEDLRNLNYFAGGLQATAAWYRETLANSEVTYFLKGKDGQSIELTVDFAKDKFAHLTGIRPVGRGISAESVLDDFVEGRGHYKNITISHNFLDKAQVLPLLQEITQTKSFVFDNLEEIEKMKSFNASHAIRSENKALVVALRTVGDIPFPATLLKSNRSLNMKLAEKATENTILGVFRSRNGKIDVLDINTDYIKDGGKEMYNILKEEELKRTRTQEEYAAKTKDTDGDGLTDEFERSVGTNPYQRESEKVEQQPMDKLQKSVNDDLLYDTVSIASLIESKDKAALSDKLEAGIKDYLNSDKYKEFLTAMSKLNNYSFSNIHLLVSQNKNISAVASANCWREEFGRYINKGAKALRVWAPTTVVKKDPKTKQPMLDENGNEIKYTTFHLAPVFDVSQTNGKELPKAVYELEGTHEDYANLYRAARDVLEENNISMEIAKELENANGYYAPYENKVVVKAGMSEQQTLKTLFHEMAHSDLHNLNMPEAKELTRSTKELQAESVAFVVASHYGFDTSEYSFGYLANWTEDQATLSDLKAQLSIVQQEAKSLIERIDTQLEKYQTKQKVKGKFEEKLNHFKEQTQESLKSKGEQLSPKHLQEESQLTPLKH